MPDEKRNADSLRWYLTGAGSDGGAQTDPDASLGNYRSSTEITQLGHLIRNPISGLTVDFVAGVNGEGDGILAARGTSEILWTPPGGTQGAAVTIANGETKVLEGNATQKYIRVSRTSANSLLGTATLVLVEQFNNVLGFDNVSNAERTAGDDEIRAVAAKNEAVNDIYLLKVWIDTLGTAAVSDSAQLGGAGAGTIGTTGSLADWPDSGFCRVEDNGDIIREVVYYTSRTDTVLTVPAAGRAQLGTAAGAGAADDNIYPVPGLRIAKEAPSSQPSGNYTDKTGAGEGSIPALTWKSGIRAADGVDIGTLSAGYQYGVWLRRAVVAGGTAEANVLQGITWSFEAA